MKIRSLMLPVISACIFWPLTGCQVSNASPFEEEDEFHTDEKIELIYNPYIQGDSLVFEVMNTGCTSKDDFIFDWHGDELTIIRTRLDLCKAMPRPIEISIPLQASQVNLQNPVSLGTLKRKPVKVSHE